MKRTNLKKLALEQLTLRILSENSLERVQGGMGYTDKCSGSCTPGASRCCEEMSRVGPCATANSGCC